MEITDETIINSIEKWEIQNGQETITLFSGDHIKITTDGSDYPKTISGIIWNIDRFKDFHFSSFDSKKYEDELEGQISFKCIKSIEKL